MNDLGTAWTGPPKRVVVLDDDELIVRAVSRSLRAKNLQVEGTTDAKKALEMVERNAPDVVVSDLHMPEACGAQFLSKVAEVAPQSMRVLISADLEFRPRQGSLSEASVHTLMSKSDLTALNVLILEQLRGRANEPATQEDREQLARRVAHVLARPRHEDDSHRHRVVEWTTRVAMALGLAEADVRDARLGAILHDVGQVTIPEQAFSRGAPLGEDALREIKQHPSAGARIVSAMPSLRSALPVISAHHERQDGTGYPARLEGSAIPKVARVFQVVDAYEALTSGRSYRARRTHGDAIAELVDGSGRHHDPEAVRALAALGEAALTLP